MRLLTAVFSAIVIFGTTSTASAYLVAHHKPGASYRTILATQTKNLAHAKYVCRNGAGRSKWWSCKAVSWLTREKQETEQRLAPPPVVRSASSGLASAFYCIHRYEGPWNANTGNGFYGGLQMDWSFMRAHGADFLARWGTADRWPVWAQIEAASRAHRTRGFSPWPNTARSCGLI